MAITMKYGYSVQDVAEQVGLSSADVSVAKSLDSHDVYFEGGIPSTTIKSKEGVSLGVAQIKPEALINLMTGKLGPAGKKILAGALHKAILKSKTKLQEQSPDTKTASTVLPSVPPQLSLENPIPLRNATELLQAVVGTSASSVYFCIAISEPVKIAARVTAENRLAFRLDGSGVKSHHESLLALGMQESSHGHYSMHLDCDSDEMVRKAIGSLMFALRINFDKICLNVEMLKGKGVGG
mgnify:CR=1 FL=1